MTLPKIVNTWLEQALTDEFGQDLSIANITSVSGGCINHACKLILSNGVKLFLKYQNTSFDDMFAQEAIGLAEINSQVELFAPKVIAYSKFGLLVEYLEPAQTNPNFWTELAKKLAQMHSVVGDAFGFPTDNFCGLTKQENKMTKDGYDFFANHRLNYQTKLALDAKFIDKELAKDIDSIANHLDKWIPEMPPVLIHGDLWSGNIMSTTDGAKIIDPACYYGWAEADLAMTCLFGGFNSDFYSSYLHYSNIDKDWEERAALYNLYHLLNHLNLFGISYLSQIKVVVRDFV